MTVRTPPFEALKFRLLEGDSIRARKLNVLVRHVRDISGGSGTTNLSYAASPTTGLLSSGTGTDAVITPADPDNAGLMLPAQVNKLAHIAISGTIDLDGIANANLAEVAASTIKGRASAGSGPVEDLTPTQVRALINVADGATSNAGTVTSVGAGVGLTGGPITSAGTLSLANTAVTPASYTLANITVDAQGRITAASNGSGGAGTVTSISGTGSVNGLTLTGTVTSSGSLTLGGNLSVAIADVTNLQSSLDAKVPTSRTISTGTGLTGGGSLSANRTISANVATQAEAEAGTSSTKLMTPQRTAQAIAALVGGGGGGDWVQIGATINTTSGSSWSFTSIPLTYQDLMLVYDGLGSTSSFTVNMEVSVDNGSNYGGQCVHSALSSTAAYGFFHILGYRNTPFAAVVYGQFRSASAPTSPTPANSSTTNNRSGVFTGGSAINAVRLNISAGTANAGTLKLFGK